MAKVNRTFKISLCFCISISLLILNMIQIFALESKEYQGKRLEYDKTAPVDFKIYNVWWKEKKDGLKFINPGQYDLKWRYETHSPSNVIQDSDGTIYFMGLDGILFAVDSNGEKTWSRKLESTGDITVSLEGTIYALCAIKAKNTNDPLDVTVHAFNKQGTRICSYVIKNTFDYYRGEGISGDEKGNFIIATEDGICSYDKKGKLNWKNNNLNRTKVKSNHNYCFSNIYQLKILHSDNIIVLTDKKMLYSLNSKGQIRWSMNAEDFGIEVSFNASGYLYNKMGKKNKVIDSKDGHVLTPAETAKLNPMDFPSKASWSGGYYYRNTLIKAAKDKNYDRGIVAYDNNDKEKWVYPVPNDYKGHPVDIAADAQGNVYFSDDAGNLYSLDKNGNERYMLIRNTTDYMPSDLMVTKKGDVLWASSEIGVLCIGIKNIRVLMDNEELNFNNPPLLENGYTLVPFRPVFEKLGLTINWDPNAKTVTGAKSDLTLSMQIGSNSCQVNGTTKQLAVAPKVFNGSTYVPLRFISETTGKEVCWDEKSKVVVIGSTEQQINYTINQFFSNLQKKDMKGILSVLNTDSEIYKAYKTNIEDELLKNSYIFDDIKIKLTITSDSKATAQITYSLTSTTDAANKQSVSAVFVLDKKSGNSWKISSIS